MDEGYLEKRYQQELQGHFDYQKPISNYQLKKINEDRQIRKKQQEQFYAAMQSQKKQIKPSIQPSSTELSKKNQKKSHFETQKKNLKIEVQQQRKKIRNQLKIYDSDGEGIISIKLRMPSSQQMRLYVHSKEPAQYLYDYVLSRENDLGFENDEIKRQFDIIEPYEKINLSERKSQKLSEIFNDQSMLSLVVNEKSE